MSTVPAAPPIKYLLGYRSRTRTRSLTLNPNPKINKKQNDTAHRNEIEHLKVDFLGTGVGL